MDSSKPTLPPPTLPPSKRQRRRRRRRTKNQQAKGPSKPQAADAARVQYARECKQNRRWLHAQLQRQDRGGITEEMRKQLTRFFSLDDAKKQWTYRLKGEGGLATKVPNLNDECTTVWERLQEERRVWRTSRLLPWKDPYAVAADWFTIEQRQGGPGSRAKSGGEEGASRQGTGGGADWEHEVESGEEIEEEEEESEGGVAVDSDGSPVAPEPVTEDEMDVEMYDE